MDSNLAKKLHLETGRVVFEIAPMASPRPRLGRYGTYMPESYQTWKKALRVLAQKQGYIFDERDAVHFVFAMPKSWSQKRKTAQLGTFHRSKPDLDNLLKSYYDALCEDDASVAQTSATKSWGERSCIIVMRYA